MKNKVLKLCKRLNKTSLKEVLPILCATEAEIQPIFDELEAEDLIKKREDGTYFYVEPESNKPKLPLFFEYRTPEELDLIIKCFCTGLPSTKTSFITGIRQNSIVMFNTFFRRMIYENQLTDLQKFYKTKPYTPRVRSFMNKTVYFYYYNNKTYISEKKLISKLQEKCLPKEEDRKFRMDYLKLTRRIVHNTMRFNIAHNISECLIRIHNKDEFIPINLLLKIIN